MKNIVYKTLLLSSFLWMFTSCSVEEYSDLNNAEVDAFADNLTRGDLQDLVGGILYSSRVDLGIYLDDCGIIGREYYRFSGSDPRFTADLLGGENAVLDNNTFYTTRPWDARYRTVKNANLILGFLDSQDLSAQFTDQELNATRGLLETFIAVEMLLNLNMVYENGIRIDVSDENNLGPFVSKDAALTGILALLDSGGSHLANGGSAFPFIMSSGYADFNTPNSFFQVNRALAARVAAYMGDYQKVLNYLSNSFLSLDAGNMDKGIYHNFSEDQTDIANPLFISPGGSSNSQARVVQPNWVADAEAGDTRLSKAFQLDEALLLDDLTGDYVLNVYNSNSANIPIIRNEELILLYAEANININPVQAVNAINIIRAGAGLGAYSGAVDAASLINEVLHQRRYSLFAEGHRWIDMRRFGKLGELPIDRPEDDVWSQFPIPLNENQ